MKIETFKLFLTVEVAGIIQILSKYFVPTVCPTHHSHVINLCPMSAFMKIITVCSGNEAKP
jgi:hypothetical protein